MFKGLCVCYAVVTMIFFNVAISGLILSNFLDDGKPLVPKWFIFMINLFTILQLSAVGVREFADPTNKQFSARNVIPGVITHSMSIILATIIAVMLPFFRHINSVIGAFGFMPLDFILPVWFSILGVLAAIAAVRQISLDAKTYRLFANV
ncbi:GABA transporter 1-like [Pyrus ussuriensis x Pyrus communis]|uniref:GABA transporter 1-like n=1 Tax=Pyrus ussuriensis x Pyrus communis TaxID=2448454 RepID=A0A5N5FYG0_9ROSA|nr:GABA transporter 1-like [Pyrus ussuriensis x Pyrus communis]